MHGTIVFTVLYLSFYIYYHIYNIGIKIHLSLQIPIQRKQTDMHLARMIQFQIMF